MEDPGPTGYDSWSAQVRDVRDRLLRETRAAGLDDRTVDELVEQAAADYRDARVHAYIGILVERAVREQLVLPRSAAAHATGTAGTDGTDGTSTGSPPTKVASTRPHELSTA
jgi:hypothetical protein